MVMYGAGSVSVLMRAMLANRGGRRQWRPRMRAQLLRCVTARSPVPRRRRCPRPPATPTTNPPRPAIADARGQRRHHSPANLLYDSAVAADERDAGMRTAAFAFLREKVRVYGDLLPRAELQRGFEYEGHKVPLLGPAGHLQASRPAGHAAQHHHGSRGRGPATPVRG